MTTHLDADTLDELKDIMQEAYPELISAYLDDSVGRLASLEAAADSLDGVSLRESAHSFKGSSSNIGAVRLAALNESVEQLAREDQVAAALPVLDEIRCEYSVVRELLERELGDRDDAAPV